MREIRPLRLTWRELETWPRRNCEPTARSKERDLETLHLPCARQFSTLPEHVRELLEPDEAEERLKHRFVEINV